MVTEQTSVALCNGQFIAVCNGHKGFLTHFGVMFP